MHYLTVKARCIRTDKPVVDIQIGDCFLKQT